MTVVQICILAVIQGASELLPVSSSAHVILAEKLIGLDPTKPEMTLLLVMLHTGTMFAVILFFWQSWKTTYFASLPALWNSIKHIALATVVTAAVGLLLKTFIETVMLRGVRHAEVELLFGNLPLISAALATVGALIIFSGWLSRRNPGEGGFVDLRGACWIGAVQGICLPFRGFSRSGATISTGLLLGITKRKAEEFSFALSVVLTPPVIIREVMRLLRARHAPALSVTSMESLFYPSLMGMVLSFIAGLLALRWLSVWLERGRWHLFGIYCLFASIVVFLLHRSGL